MKKALILSLIALSLLCTSCEKIESTIDVEEPQETTIESTIDTTDTNLTETETSEDTTTISDDTQATTEDTTTIEDTTTSEDSETITEDTTSKAIQTTTEDTTTHIATSENTTVSAEQSAISTANTDEIQLTPLQMLDEMLYSKGDLSIAYDDGNMNFTTMVYCSKVSDIEQYLENIDYIPNSTPSDTSSSDRKVSISLEYTDLFGDLCCKETLSIYDVSSLNLEGGNCVVEVEIYDPDGGMYHNSFESYTVYVSNLDSLFEAVANM